MGEYKKMGVFVGVVTAASYINLYFSLPLVLLLVLMMSKAVVSKIGVTAYISALVLALFSGLILMGKRGDDLIIIAPHFFLIISLTIGLCLRLREEVIEGFEAVMATAVIMDFAVNVITLIMMQDPFGRALDVRRDGLVRMNGIFGHPFISVAISVLGAVIGVGKNNKKLLILVISNMLLNQTLRSYISLILILLIYLILSRKKRRFLAYIFFSISFSISIWIATIISINPANQMRVLAWTNSIGIILDRPMLGMSGFERVDFASEGVSEGNLILSGVSENFYLDIAMHFGIPLAVILLMFFIWISWKILKRIDVNQQEKRLSLIFLVMMTDSFYGNLMVTSLLSIYLMLCLMDKNVKFFDSGSTGSRVVN